LGGGGGGGSEKGKNLKEGETQAWWVMNVRRGKPSDRREDRGETAGTRDGTGVGGGPILMYKRRFRGASEKGGKERKNEQRFVGRRWGAEERMHAEQIKKTKKKKKKKRKQAVGAMSFMSRFALGLRTQGG